MSVIVGRDVGTYTFDASAQTITILWVGNLMIQDIDLVTNQTSGIIIYNFASQTAKGSLMGWVLTLDYPTNTDPVGMSNTDEIQIRLGRDYTTDFDLSTIKTSPQNYVPKPSYSEDYDTFTAVDTSFVEGTVFQTSTDYKIKLNFSKTASDLDDTYIKVVNLPTFAWAIDYQESSISAPTAWETIISTNLYVLAKGAVVSSITIWDVWPYTRIDVAKKTDTGTDAVLTCSITHIPR